VGGVYRFFVTSIHVSRDAESGIVGQNAVETPCRFIGSIRD
jgi:hypothetical protein